MAERGPDPRLGIALAAVVLVLVVALLAWIAGRSGDDEPANTNPSPATQMPTRGELHA